MQQTTRTGTQNSAGPLADAGPYDYDLPAVRGGAGQPANVSQPASKGGGSSWKSGLVIALVSITAPMLKDLSGWPLLHCYGLLYYVAAVLSYWSKPKPRRGFVRWVLEVTGLFLNAFVALVTVPNSLRGLLPDFWALALPSFALMLIFYWVPPLLPIHDRKLPLWQWLIYAALMAVVWGFTGVGALR